MRAATLSVTVSAALALAACAGPELPQPLGLNGTPVGETAAPMPIADHDWFLFDEDDEAYLLYGLADSDDIWLTLACRRGTARIQLARPADSDGKPSIYLESGGESEEFQGWIDPSELFEHGEVLAETSTGLVVFQRFRHLGWLALHDAAGRAVMVAHPQSRAGIETFFARCG